MRIQLSRLATLATALALAAACGDDAEPYPATTDAGADTNGTVDAGDTGLDAASDPPTADAAPDAEPEPSPDLVAYSGGACPQLQAGDNSLASSGASRTVELYFPPDPEGAPVVFFWYGAGGSTQSYQWMQPFANGWDVIIAVPRAMPNMLFEWPIMASNQPANELVFFDDMVACLVDTLAVDTRRIYTSGFSAGALWSTYLVMKRSHVLASAVIFSGGTGELVRAYESPEVDIPILGMHGGETDTYGGFVNFEEQMTEFMDGLVDDGHLVIACDHGLGHTIPNAGLDWGIQFLLAHVWGDTSSPFQNRLPTYLPNYCDFWQ